MIELAGVGGEALLVLEQGAHAASLLRRAAAVEAEDDFVADVDGAEARRAGEDVEEVLQLVGLERRQLGPGGGGHRLRALLELGAKLAASERHRRAVAETLDETLFHEATLEPVRPAHNAAFCSKLIANSPQDRGGLDLAGCRLHLGFPHRDSEG